MKTALPPRGAFGATASLPLPRLRRLARGAVATLATAVGLWLGAPAHAAIAVDAVASTSTTNVTTVTWSHAVGTGASILLVELATEDTSTSVLNVTTITYNGVAMTAVPSSTATTGSSTFDRTQLFYLLSPPSGTHTVSVTFGGTVNDVAAGSLSLSGTTGAPGSAVIATATSGNAISASASVATAGSWVVDVVCSGASNATFTAGSNQTVRWSKPVAGNGGEGSTQAPANTGAVTSSYTASSSSQLALSVAVVAPSGTTATAPSITTQPVSQTVTVGSPVTFTVAATGTAPLAYQWTKNGTAITDATSASYTISSAQTSDAGNYAVTVSNSAGSVTSNTATLTVNSTTTAPTITAQPASQTVNVGDTATFSVTASGTAPLAYQWSFNGAAISGATGATYSIANVQTSNAGGYSVVVSNSAGSVTSTTATLTVSTSTGSNAQYNLTGFATLGSGTTGGGVIADTDSRYRKVSTALDLANALIAAKTAGAVKVIEIMNDLNLGWNEIGSTVQTLSSTPFRAHNPPQLHPVLLQTGMSLLDIKVSNITIFSANGATIRHCNFNIKGASNIVIRNLKFDENWEWDEATKGNYDKNDWDFITISNGGAATNIWIDHCTFTKSYDGIVDQKAGTQYVTLSWCKYVGDDGATNSNSWVWQQMNALEANRSAYTFYNFLRTNGFSEADIVQIIQGHDKTHLMGSNSLDSGNDTLSATFHHLWLNSVWDRCVPRLRAGNVHDYDLYVDDSNVLAAKRLRDARAAAMSSSAQSTLNNTYSFNPPINGSISTENGAVLVEKSVYQDCLWPLRNNQTDPTNSVYTGKILATDTIYTFHNTDGTVTSVRGNSTDPNSPLGPFQAPIISFSWNGYSSVPYAYTSTVTDPANLLSVLQTGCGAGVLTWSKDNWLKTTY